MATSPPHVSVCHGIEVMSAFLQIYNGGWLSKLSRFEEARSYEIRRKGLQNKEPYFKVWHLSYSWCLDLSSTLPRKLLKFVLFIHVMCLRLYLCSICVLAVWSLEVDTASSGTGVIDGLSHRVSAGN